MWWVDGLAVILSCGLKAIILFCLNSVGWGGGHTVQWRQDSRIPRSTQDDWGLDFKMLLVLWFSGLLSICYEPIIPAGPGNMDKNRGWRTRPLGTYPFKAFPGMTQKHSSRIPWFGFKPTEVRKQPFPAVCELMIFFLCRWGQLLSCSTAIKLLETLKSMLLLITVSAVSHTLIISLWHRQWPF